MKILKITGPKMEPQGTTFHVYLSPCKDHVLGTVIQPIANTSGSGT